MQDLEGSLGVGAGIWDQQQGPVQGNYRAKPCERHASVAAQEQTRGQRWWPSASRAGWQSCATALHERPQGGEVFLAWDSGAAPSSSARQSAACTPGLGQELLLERQGEKLLLLKRANEGAFWPN